MMRNNGHEGTDTYTGFARCNNVKHASEHQKYHNGRLYSEGFWPNTTTRQSSTSKNAVTSSDWPFYRATVNGDLMEYYPE